MDPVTNRFDELVLFHGVDFLEFADVIERSLSESRMLYLQVLVVLQTDIVKMKLYTLGTLCVNITVTLYQEFNGIIIDIHVHMG